MQPVAAYDWWHPWNHQSQDKQPTFERNFYSFSESAYCKNCAASYTLFSWVYKSLKIRLNSRSF